MKTTGRRLTDLMAARAVVRHLLMLLAVLCAGAGVSMATATWGRAADAPTITTDAADYLPGTTVTYAGTGFEPGEIVDLIAVGSADGYTITTQSTADATGNIGGSFDLPYQPEPSYTLTATGESSGLVATTTFLDRTITVTVPASTWTEGLNTAPTQLASFVDSNATPNITYSVTVNWGDGTASTLLSVSNPSAPTGCVGQCTFHVGGAAHAYAEEGSKTITVTVTANNSPSASGSNSGTATITDAALHATAGSAIAATEGTSTGTVTVATFSDDDPGGTLGDYSATIDWGDGTTPSTGTVSLASTGHWAVTGSHTYADEVLPTGSTDTVTVTIHDSGGASTATTLHATVGDAGLSIGSGSGVSAVEGSSTGTIVLAPFSDANLSATAADFTATVNWGDGSATEPAAVVSTGTAGSFDVTGSHTYAEEGSPTITVHVSDDGGSSGGVTETAQVSDAALAVVGKMTSVVTTEGNSTGTVTWATFTDADPSGTAGDYSATITWGDGTQSAGTILSSGSAFVVQGSHTYAEPGTFSPSISISDAVSSTGATAVVTVDDAALSATGGSPISATEGVSTGTLTVASFTDGNPAATTADFTAQINWGDGTVDDATVLAGSGDFLVQGSHTYVEESSSQHTVLVHIVDVDGSTATTGLAADVADAALSATPHAALNATEGAATGAISALATFSDVDPLGTASDFHATIDWGDGSALDTSTTISSLGGGSFAVDSPVGHLFQDEGNDSVTVTITDVGGSSTDAVVQANVSDAALSPVATTPFHAVEGQSTGPVTVASFSDANLGAPSSDFTATIDWGDGTPSSTGTVSGSGGGFVVTGSHTYTEEGSPPLSVNIIDDGGNTLSTQLAPTVDDAALTVTAAAPVTATEAASTGTVTVATFTDDDPNGAPGQYTASIDWGDGSITPGTVLSMVNGSFPVTGQHTYAEEGPYSVSVTVRDDPASSTASSPVTVGDAAVHITAAPGISAVEGSSYSGVIAAFIDGNPAAGTGDFSALVDWGDNTTTGAQVVAVSGGFEVIGSHTYADEGTFFPSVSIEDDGGASDFADLQAVVGDAALSLSPAPGVHGTEGTLLSDASLASLTDANPLATAADFKATVDWGDGSAPQSVGAGSPVAGAFPISGSHLYTEEGTYTVTVSVEDDGGSTTGTTLTATIGDAALIAGTVVAPAQIEGNATPAGMGLATFTDTSLNGSPADFTATVNWGDGSPPDGNTTIQHLTGGSYEVLGDSHTYAEEGTYTVSVSVSDVGGSTTMVVGPLTVLDASLGVSTPSFTAVEGAVFSGVVTTFTDNDPNASTTKEQYAATIDWGDGTSSGTVLSEVNGSFPVTGQHTYAEEGPHSVTVSVSDDGGSSATSTAGTINVADAALHITATSPISAVEGAPFTAPLATFTDDDPAGSVSAGDYVAHVTWGDGTTSTEPVVAGGGGFQVIGTHTYTEEGSNLPASVTIDDVGGSTVSTPLTAGVSDAALTVVATPAIQATEGMATGTLTVGSFTDADPGGAAGDYTVSIDWGDGTPLDTTTATVQQAGSAFQVTSAGHTYAEEGTYAVKVFVADAGGSTAQIAPVASVADAPLTLITSTSGFAGLEGHTTGTLALAQLSDADPGHATSDYTVTVDWGDGSGPQPVTLNGAYPYIVGAGHTYTEEGTYTVTVSAVDHGTPVSGTLPVTITDGSLTLATPALTATEGQATPAGQAISSISDANPFATAADFSAVVNWGDGTPASNATIGSQASDGSFPVVVPSHVFAEEGPSTVTVTVTDDGGATQNAQGTATVQDAALAATAGTTINTYVATPTGPETTATFTDANLAATSGDYTATIDWGDGSQSSGTVSGPSGGVFTVTAPAHAWTGVGTDSVKTVITDDGNATTSATLTANVGPIPVSITGLSATPNPTEFTDTATLHATVTALNNDAGALTGNLVFMVNGRPTTGVPSPAIAINTATGTQSVNTTLTLDQSIVPPGAGAYSLSASFTSTNVDYAGASGTVPNGATVTQEPVSLNYSGDWFVLDTATPHLSVLVNPVDGMDPAWVDYSKVAVSVQFKIYNGGGSLVQGPFTVPVVNASNWSTTGIGSAQTNGSGPLSTDGTYQVVATLMVNGYVAGPDGQAVLTSSPATGSFITGGGFIDPDSTANSPDSNHHGNFGITVKFNKSLTNLQGNALYIYRAYMDVTTGALCTSSGPNCRDVDVVVKSNSLTYLSVTQASSTTGSGVITGKFSVQYNDAVTGQQYTQFGFGNGSFQVNVVDGGSGGTYDQYAGAFRRSDGTIFHLSTGTTTSSTGSAQLVTIKQGNVTVHQ